MPRRPGVAASSASLSSRVFAHLAAAAAERRAGGEVVHALSVGDTYKEPLAAARTDAQGGPERHRYAPVQGEPTLLAAIAEKLAARGRAVPEAQIQVTAGATSGLSVVAAALLDPGDEVLLPAPFWPLIRGILAGRGAVPVQVPLWPLPGAAEVEARLEAAVTPRTTALYVNSPHNPTGAVLAPDVVDAFARVARRHDLWLICDECYEDLWFGARPNAIWAREDVQDRYVAAHTVSKGYGLAGIRVGWVQGAPAAMSAIRGVQTFMTYCAPRPMQHGARAALREGDAFLASCRADYAAAGARVADALGIAPPAGGTFVFFDASPYLAPGEEDALGFLGRCLERGVLMTPGTSCGADFARWVRLCFTSVPPEALDDALDRLRPLLG
ncbi:MAG: pyridoxal phosphate-dependent aminotransferase [Myxococcota bacterium]